MASLPDKIFHDKLAGYQHPAPPGAWQRIEKGLDHSNGFSIFFKVAAAILAVVIAGYVVWSPSSHNGKPSQVITSNTPDHPNKMNTTPTNVQPEVSEEPETIEIIVRPSANNYTRSDGHSMVAKNEDNNRIFERDHTQPSEEQPMEELTPQSVEENKTIDVTAFETKETANEISPRKIIYSVEHVQNRFLKKNAPSFNDNEKEPVRKQNITAVAYGVAHSLKNSDIGLGELRQIKDEFFALDFLAGNDKTTKNKN